MASGVTWRLICWSRRRWKKQLLATRLTCCFIVSWLSRSTLRSRTTPAGCRVMSLILNVRSAGDDWRRTACDPNQISSVLDVLSWSRRDAHHDCRSMILLHIPSYIGWMFLSESCTNSASWCSTACTVKRLSRPTSWNCANQSQVSHHVNIFDPPPNSFWSYRVTSSAPMADELSVWLIRRSGIPCRTACRIRLLAGTVSDNLWRPFCSQRTDAFSALEVSRRCADFYLLAYLLTYS